MSDILYLSIIIFLILVGVYILGRIFTRGVLHEVDNYIVRKFNKHLKLKDKENGTEKEK